MKHRSRQYLTLTVCLVLGLIVTACGPEPAEPMPTRTPAPTFTPTAEVVATQVDPVAAATAKALAAEETQQQPATDGGQPPAAAGEVVEVAPAPADTPVPEPPTPAPAAEAIVDNPINVRGGPGTNYGIIGNANVGERFPITGRNNEGTWWQVDFQGQPGWLFGELISTVSAESVAVAANIPAPPPPPPTAVPVPPTATPQPQPQGPPPTPKPNWTFSRALLQRCDPNAGVTYVEGTVYKGGNPVNGYIVAFSYSPDAEAVAKVEAGPHAGYEGWRTGFYSHILSTTGPRAGNWFFWVEDSAGNRVSATGNVQTDGSAGDGKCQQAVIDFDS